MAGRECFTAEGGEGLRARWGKGPGAGEALREPGRRGRDEAGMEGP